MTTEQLIIEGIARMDESERESLVRNLVERYPDLADGLMANIGYELMDQDTKKETMGEIMGDYYYGA
jgi:hypothetical protein